MILEDQFQFSAIYNPEKNLSAVCFLFTNAAFMKCVL